MPKFTFFSQELPSNQEFEFKNNFYGFRVTIHDVDGNIRTYRNVSEIHINHKPGFCALEQPLHSCGENLWLTRYTSITVEETEGCIMDQPEHKIHESQLIEH